MQPREAQTYLKRSCNEDFNDIPQGTCFCKNKAGPKILVQKLRKGLHTNGTPCIFCLLAVLRTYR